MHFGRAGMYAPFLQKFSIDLLASSLRRYLPMMKKWCGPNIPLIRLVDIILVQRS
jgi:hypothetical protein